MDSESHEIEDPRVHVDSGTERKVGPMTGGHPRVMEPETTEYWGHGPFRVMVSPPMKLCRFLSPCGHGARGKGNPSAHIGTFAKFKTLQLM